MGLKKQRLALPRLEAKPYLWDRIFTLIWVVDQAVD
jgi:hypothetical protein